MFCNYLLKIFQIINVKTGHCLDRLEEEKAGVFKCLSMGGNQTFTYTKRNQIMFQGELCLTDDNKSVKLIRCTNDNSDLEWEYNNNVLLFTHTEK